MLKNVFAMRRVGRRLLSVLLCVILAASLLTVAAAERDSNEPSWVGDATPGDYDIRIVGLVEEWGFFTMEGLRSIAADLVQTGDYSWMDDSGSAGTYTYTGVYIEDLLNTILKLNDDAGGILVTGSDGYRMFRLDTDTSGAYWTDRNGGKMMLAWSGKASNTNCVAVDFDLPMLAIGQAAPDEINRSDWVSDVVEIWVLAFNDLQGVNWREIAFIEGLYNGGAINGVGNHRFAPAESLNRATFVTMLGRALNTDTSVPPAGERRFGDVDYESWYGMHVEWAVDNGIVQGYEDGTFRPTENLTVEHMLLMAERAGLEEVPEEIDAEAQRYATRLEAAVVLYKMVTRTTYSWEEETVEWYWGAESNTDDAARQKKWTFI